MPDSCNYQVPDMSNSFSHPSEAPDIRNWFSSYAYESPELNTYKDWEDSSLIVHDSEEDEVDNGEMRKQVGKEKKLEGTIRNNDKLNPDEVDLRTKYTNAFQDCACTEPSQVLGSLSDSLLLSPEPPHIGRWFSSYVYESPSLDTCINFTGSESQCVQFDGERRYAKNCSLVNESNLGNLRSVPDRSILPTDEKVLPFNLVTCSNSLEDTNLQLQSTSKGTTAVAVIRSDITDLNLPSKKIPERLLEVKPIEDHSIDSTHVKRRDHGGEDFISREPLNNASSSKSKRLQKLAQKSDLSQHSAHTENQVRVPSESPDKKNKENGFQENGFISTRKKASGIRSGANPSKRSVEVPLVRNTEHVLKRKPFSEITNFQHNDGLEITGKWKCPRKSNPNRGPPLKQLRLEQWVNRM